MTPSLLKLPISDGINPVNELDDKFKSMERWDIFKISFGIPPVKKIQLSKVADGGWNRACEQIRTRVKFRQADKISDSRRLRKFGKLPRFGGIVPLSQFCGSSIISRRDALDNDAGIGPENLLQDRLINSRRGRDWPKSGGSEPDRW
ncbi:uncharacterized protein A4U43_C08F26470 [Asparagus officinalis]|nr:uncharacterized protein A4U43_C08F26470 [Asparagus officinalis]